MARRPNRYDMVFVAEYALKMINVIPNTAQEIKLAGDVLYAYYVSHGEIADDAFPILSYTAYSDFYETIASSINLPDNEIPSETRVYKNDCIAFNQFFDNFWYANQRMNVFGAITVDLSRFKELECFSIYQIYCKTIIHIPQTLKFLHCRSCNLSKLNKMPKILEILNCSGNKLRSLPQLYHTSLKSLFCNSNQLKKIPALPKTLEWLYCYDNIIHELPTPLPISLEFLSCSRNDLTRLPDLPPKLVGLYIDQNFIRNIPPLPKTLIDFFFANNQVTKMPELPSFLKRITCNMNPLREYTPFPPSIKYANIDGTLMEL
uniref:Leucine-rich repeat domain-containing protein n=1 Tax=viral metagenome TaxID=1070528 RepID=A0A6C0K161_9ZZZZ